MILINRFEIIPAINPALNSSGDWSQAGYEANQKLNFIK